MKKRWNICKKTKKSSERTRIKAKINDIGKKTIKENIQSN
jgi:hypothetical protein